MHFEVQFCPAKTLSMKMQSNITLRSANGSKLVVNLVVKPLRLNESSVVATSLCLTIISVGNPAEIPSLQVLRQEQSQKTSEIDEQHQTEYDPTQPTPPASPAPQEQLQDAPPQLSASPPPQNSDEEEEIEEGCVTGCMAVKLRNKKRANNKELCFTGLMTCGKKKVCGDLCANCAKLSKEDSPKYFGSLEDSWLKKSCISIENIDVPVIQIKWRKKRKVSGNVLKQFKMEQINKGFNVMSEQISKGLWYKPPSIYYDNNGLLLNLNDRDTKQAVTGRHRRQTQSQKRKDNYLPLSSSMTLMDDLINQYKADLQNPKRAKKSLTNLKLKVDEFNILSQEDKIDFFEYKEE